MYNVIVAYDSTAWETDQLMRLTADRFKEYSGGPEADQIDLAKPATMRRLEGIPTLLFYEACAEGAAAKNVRFGTVSAVHHSKGEVVFRFTEKGRFARAVLDELPAGSTSVAMRSTGRMAIKEGGIPSAMLSRLRPTYDIVFFLRRRRPGVCGEGRPLSPRPERHRVLRRI